MATPSRRREKPGPTGVRRRSERAREARQRDDEVAAREHRPRGDALEDGDRHEPRGHDAVVGRRRDDALGGVVQAERALDLRHHARDLRAERWPLRRSARRNTQPAAVATAKTIETASSSSVGGCATEYPRGSRGGAATRPRTRRGSGCGGSGALRLRSEAPDRRVRNVANFFAWMCGNTRAVLKATVRAPRGSRTTPASNARHAVDAHANAKKQRALASGSAVDAVDAAGAGA